MILVDIEIPMLKKVYDFQLDETVPIRMVLNEIEEMICQKQQCTSCGELQSLTLWEQDTHRLLAPGETLAQNRIMTGSRLLMV